MPAYDPSGTLFHALSPVFHFGTEKFIKVQFSVEQIENTFLHGESSVEQS
jgi:hypothetical protein